MVVYQNLILIHHFFLGGFYKFTSDKPRNKKTKNLSKKFYFFKLLLLPLKGLY